MPDLNLNEEGAMEEQTPSEQPSEPELKRPRHAASGQAARLIIIFVALGVLAGTAYMLNELGIVKLWGPKEPVVARVEEPVQQQPSQQTPAEQLPAQQPAKEPAKAEQKKEEPKKEPPKKEEPKPSVAQQPAKQEPQAAPPSVAKQEPKQEAKPQAPVQEQPKAAVTSPIEQKPVAEMKKAEEPPKMLFRLKDPIVFSSKPRPRPTLAMQTTVPAMKEEPVAKPKEQPRPKESAPTLKMAVPQQPKAVEPKKEAPAQVAQQTAKQEPPAPPKQQQTAPKQAEPKKETVAQAPPPKQVTPSKPKEEAPKTTAPKTETMKGTYTVQVYAFREKGNAETAVKRLTDNGYPAFIEPIDAKGMTWYTVRIGRYPSASEAKKAVESFAQEIKEHHFIDKVRTKEN